MITYYVLVCIGFGDFFAFNEIIRNVFKQRTVDSLSTKKNFGKIGSRKSFANFRFGSGNLRILSNKSPVAIKVTPIN